MHLQSNGLILQSIPYLGEHRILKVLTPDSGLLSLIARKAASTKGNWSCLTTPFALGEWVYDQKGELHRLRDAKLLDDLSYLKADYDRLQAAGKIAHLLLRTQAPGKQATTPYELTLSYYQRLRTAPLPSALALSFCLKLLAYEGVVHLQSACSLCQEPAAYLNQGECFCPAHAPPLSERCSEIEFQQILHLGLSRSFSQIESVPVTAGLQKKVDSFLDF